MPDHVYQKIELTGSSTVSIENAIENAIAKAGETINSLRWFEVVGNPRPYRQWQGCALAGDDQGGLYARLSPASTPRYHPVQTAMTRT